MEALGNTESGVDHSGCVGDVRTRAMRRRGKRKKKEKKRK